MTSVFHSMTYDNLSESCLLITIISIIIQINQMHTQQQQQQIKIREVGWSNSFPFEFFKLFSASTEDPAMILDLENDCKMINKTQDNH